jgi:UDP-N-acetylmuramate dehydrogenase
MSRASIDVSPAVEDARVQELLEQAVGSSSVLRDEPMSKYTSFRVGGPARWLVRAHSADSLMRVVIAANESGLRCRIIGGGSNVLVADEGIDAVVILNRATSYELVAESGSFLLIAESGVSLPRLAGELARRGAAGMEWGVGVPGTVGGAVVQNAGAWGSEMKDRLLSVQVLQHGEAVAREVAASELGLRYRGSVILDTPPVTRPVVLRAHLRLERDDPAAILARNARYSAERTAKQPRALSGGSVFRNPPGDYAGRLLEAAGLKGYRIGGAGFSEQHANFIVNYGDARASDIQQLVDVGRAGVRESFGVQLEPEIEFVGNREGPSS